MMSRAGVRALDAVLLLMVLGLPLLGAWWSGDDLRQFLHFPPPLAIPTDYLRFSWLAAGAVIACVLALVLPWMPRVRLRSPGSAGVPPANETPSGEFTQRSPLRPFPNWGLVALSWTLLWWMLAWTRWEWFAPLQRYTFFPLWIGFIVTVNAATQRRTGSCLMRRAPGPWLTLFLVSAGCWWVFEWLNRFVQNWHYLGTEGFGAVSYALHATLCFSTVLPATAAVAEWISSHAGWSNWVATGPRWRWLQRRGTAVALLVGGVTALVCTGAFPRWSYPALWVAPLALFLGALVLTGRRSVPAEVAGGDWTRAASWMIAALICGFFWELWNWRSVAKWIYTVPGVDRWHFFEMPALGYAGYLPFGLECLLVVERVVGSNWGVPRAPRLKNSSRKLDTTSGR